MSRTRKRITRKSRRSFHNGKHSLKMRLRRGGISFKDRLKNFGSKVRSMFTRTTDVNTKSVRGNISTADQPPESAAIEQSAPADQPVAPSVDASADSGVLTEEEQAAVDYINNANTEEKAERLLDVIVGMANQIDSKKIIPHIKDIGKLTEDAMQLYNDKSDYFSNKYAEKVITTTTRKRQPGVNERKPNSGDNQNTRNNNQRNDRGI